MNERIKGQNAQLTPLPEQLGVHKENMDQVNFRLKRAAKKVRARAKGCDACNLRRGRTSSPLPLNWVTSPLLVWRQGKRWGSFGRNLLCMLVLMGQLFALGYTIDFVLKERRAARHRGSPP